GPAVDLAQALPADSGGDARELLAPGHDSHRLDLEAGAGAVGGAEEQVPTVLLGDRVRRAQGVRTHVRARDHGRVEGPFAELRLLEHLLQLELLGAVEARGDRASGVTRRRTSTSARRPP